MDIDVAITQISRLKYLLSLPNVDVAWSRYDCADEVIKDLELLEKGVLNRDEDAISQLLYLLAPTGALQEISIGSGWGEEFLIIADILEVALSKRMSK